MVPRPRPVLSCPAALLLDVSIKGTYLNAEIVILVPMSLSLICTLFPPYQWQEIGRPRFSSSPQRLGVSLQFPILKKEHRVF